MPNSLLMRRDVERLGTGLVALVTVVTLVSLGAYGSLKMAVTDLYTQAAVLNGDHTRPPRSTLGEKLSAPLASDIAPNDGSGLNARADQLEHRADRLIELTAVVALLGMLVALLIGRPAIEADSARDDATPLASTSSNGN